MTLYKKSGQIKKSYGLSLSGFLKIAFIKIQHGEYRWSLYFNPIFGAIVCEP